MFWKNWPNWLKAGIIVGIIFVIWFFAIYILERVTCKTPVSCGIGTAVLNLPSVIVVDVLLVRIGFFSMLGKVFGVHISEVTRFAFIPIVNFIIGFLFGVIIGLIYGKIENKKVIQ